MVLAYLVSIFFGLLAIFFSLREENSRKKTKGMSFEEVQRVVNDSLHVVVHELRAPVTAIKDASEVLLSSISAMPKHSQEELLRLIEKQSNLLLEQVSSILDAAKLQNGKFALQKKESSLRALIEERISVFTPQAHNQHIQIVARLDGHLENIYFDQQRISQVINNLLSNSLKYTGENGTITITTSLTPPGFVTVSVADTGIGIEKSKQSVLFNKYSPTSEPTGNFQRHNNGDPIHPTSSSSGLGLYIVKGIVEAHGGSVWVNSEVGKGTTIYFTLPLVYEDKTDHSTKQPPIHSPQQHISP